MKTAGSKIVTAFVVFFVFYGGGLLQGQNKAENISETESCRHFAQQFYDWYTAQVALSFHHKNSDPLMNALDQKKEAFSGDLERGLRRVRAEEAKSHDAILDFDPILNSQDPAERYAVRSVRKKDGHFFVDVYGVWRTPPADLGKGPQVVTELIFRDGRWVFVNFHYPDSTDSRNENLLSFLNNEAAK